MSWLALWGQIASSGPLALHAPEHDTYCDRWRVAFVIAGIEGANVSARSHPHRPWEFALVQKEHVQRRCGHSQELSNAIAPLLALSHQMDAKVDTEYLEFGIVHLFCLSEQHGRPRGGDSAIASACAPEYCSCGRL